MSLASVLLRSRLPSAAAASSPLLSSSPWSTLGSVVGRRPPSRPQIRNSGVMMEEVRRVPSDDPNREGQMTFEDPELTDLRMKRAFRAEEPLRRKPNFTRHEKQWMKRKRLKMEKRYNRLKEGLDELKAYIQFKQDNKSRW